MTPPHVSTDRRAALLAALVAVLVLAGCSGAADRSSSGRTPAASADASPGAASSSASASASPPPAPPGAACYRLSTADLTRPANDAAPVPCSSRHTARTIYVGRLHHADDASASDAVQRQLSTTCPRRLARYVGGSSRTRDLSRFQVVWFSPTQEETDAGAAWFRCDLVAFSRGDRLLPLPTKGGLANVLADPGALDTYGLCGTAAPGARGFQRVVCGQRHSWRAIDTIALTGGPAYPGTATVRKAGGSVCRARARAKAADTLRFTYGWEWPTAAQWRAGQHFGYCWAPS